MTEDLIEQRLYWRSTVDDSFGVWATYWESGVQVATCGQEPPHDHEIIDLDQYHEICLERLHRTQQEYYRSQAAQAEACASLETQRSNDVDLLVQNGIPQDLAQKLIPAAPRASSVPFGTSLSGLRPFLAHTYRLPSVSIDRLLEEAEVG
jgi:hypothetical protein